MRSQEQQLESISRKLDVLIGLLARIVHKGDPNDAALILRLEAAGLSPEETARALGKSPNAVYLILSRQRRRPK
jgi:DNA-directed RNA polymerase specialized sigma24 family protein